MHRMQILLTEKIFHSRFIPLVLFLQFKAHFHIESAIILTILLKNFSDERMKYCTLLFVFDLIGKINGQK